MKSIITGDIVQSRSVKNAEIWIKPLKVLFGEITSSQYDWDIFRGDSFQLMVETTNSLRYALLIKSAIKRIKNIKLDVRLAIGMGEADYIPGRVSEGTGEAFVYSGTLLDELDQGDIHLGIKTPWPLLDGEFNMMFRLALVIMNGWTQNTAEVAYFLFQQAGITQIEIAKELGIAQSTVNDRIKRGAVYEIIELETYYREKINKKIAI